MFFENTRAAMVKKKVINTYVNMAHAFGLNSVKKSAVTHGVEGKWQNASSEEIIRIGAGIMLAPYAVQLVNNAADSNRIGEGVSEMNRKFLQLAESILLAEASAGLREDQREIIFKLRKSLDDITLVIEDRERNPTAFYV
ncbi:MAG: hypothetical protein PF450_06505 [Bacteroidales bacterium]|jgi:hypothetical protein|nr:hypothetical protein [Bacteroidales bacterium]